MDSVVAQAYEPLEIVVVDDGSTDGTASIAAAYDRLPVRLARHPANQGSSVALNRAIDMASHEFIAFLDADDIWLPGKLEAQVGALAAMPDATLVATGYQWVNPDGSMVERGLQPFDHAGHDFWRTLLLQSAISKPTVLTRRSLVQQLGGFDPRFKVAEDQDMWIRLAMVGPVCFIHRPLMRTYNRPGSLMKRYRRYDLHFTLPMIEKNLALLGDRLTPAERRAILGRRYAEAAQHLLDEQDWWPAIGAVAKAVRYGHRPIANIANLILWLARLNGAKRRLLKALHHVMHPDI